MCRRDSDHTPPTRHEQHEPSGRNRSGGVVERLGLNWRLHGDGRHVAPGDVVTPRERLAWPRTISIGAQHVVAMFGATFLVPLLTGFPPATTLFFSGIGTVLFLVITAGRVPSYLGSSFAFIAPITASCLLYTSRCV